MDINEIDKKLIKNIEDGLYDAMRELDISCDFDKNDFLIFGAQKDENNKLEEIDIFVHNTIRLYSSSEKYNIKELSDDSSFYDGERLANNDINEFLKNKSFFNDLKVNVFSSLEEFDDVFPNQDSFNLSDFIDIQLIKRKKETVKKLETSDKPNVVNSEEVRKLFSELGYKQRGLPEAQMLKCQRFIGGGVVSHLIEHVGDLTHRLSENIFSSSGDLEGTLEFVNPKVKKAITVLKSEYGFLKEHDENLISNYHAYKDTNGISAEFDEWKTETNNMLLDYSQKHSELPVYNEAQYLAREAAVELGRLNIDKTVKHLEKLNDIIDNGNYLKSISECEVSGYKPKADLKNKKNRKYKI